MKKRTETPRHKKRVTGREEVGERAVRDKRQEKRKMTKEISIKTENIFSVLKVEDTEPLWKKKNCLKLSK